MNSDNDPSLLSASSQIRCVFGKKIPKGPWAALSGLWLTVFNFRIFSWGKTQGWVVLRLLGSWKGWDTWMDFGAPLTIPGSWCSCWWMKPLSASYLLGHQQATSQRFFRARVGIKQNIPELQHNLLLIRGVRREENLLSQSWYFSFITRIKELWETYKVNVDKWFYSFYLTSILIKTFCHVC